VGRRLQRLSHLRNRQPDTHPRCARTTYRRCTPERVAIPARRL